MMRNILEKKALNKLKEDEIELFEIFCNANKSLIKSRLKFTNTYKMIENENIKLETAKHSSDLSSILGHLLVKTDEVKIVINKELLDKISLENNLDYKMIEEMIVLHEFIHYYAYKNKIELEYKPKGFLKRKVRESEELIVNDLVNQYLHNNVSIYDLYSYL